MRNATRNSSIFRLGIVAGVPWSNLSTLFALQRAQEPQATIAVIEVSDAELIEGLLEGRYHAGMSLHRASAPSLCSTPLWQENMALVIPLRSPLLARAKLKISDLQHYPVLRWPAETCPLLDQRMSSVLPGLRPDGPKVASFEMMALWVAAGYGVGVTAQSRITRALAWGLCMRPLSETEPYEIVTHLLRPTSCSVSERFERRALQIDVGN
ncbi:MAG: LysR substrate-binding domain-containing protein [Burkholderiaceae bacterium]